MADSWDTTLLENRFYDTEGDTWVIVVVGLGLATGVRERDGRRETFPVIW